jgi:hypothetical protein
MLFGPPAKCQLYDAWEYSAEVLVLIVALIKLIGSDEFTYLMEKALNEAKGTASEKRVEHKRLEGSL